MNGVSWSPRGRQAVARLPGPGATRTVGRQKYPDTFEELRQAHVEGVGETAKGAQAWVQDTPFDLLVVAKTVDTHPPPSPLRSKNGWMSRFVEGELG